MTLLGPDDLRKLTRKRAVRELETPAGTVLICDLSAGEVGEYQEILASDGEDPTVATVRRARLRICRLSLVDAEGAKIFADDGSVAELPDSIVMAVSDEIFDRDVAKGGVDDAKKNSGDGQDASQSSDSQQQQDESQTPETSSTS